MKSGHYVLVKPTPLKDPLLIINSESMLEELGISLKDSQSLEFTKFFSGQTDVIDGFSQTWATPYALSIYG